MLIFWYVQVYLKHSSLSTILSRSNGHLNQQIPPSYYSCTRRSRIGSKLRHMERQYTISLCTRSSSNKARRWQAPGLVPKAA